MALESFRSQQFQFAPYWPEFSSILKKFLGETSLFPLIQLEKPNRGFIIPYMGIIAQGKGLWNALFTRTQRQVLSLMFGFPDRSFYANEIVRLAGVGTGSVQRELARLSGSGLLIVSRVGNQKHYQANRQSPIFAELHSIVIKTFGALDQLRLALGELPGEIELALIYGPGVRMAAQDSPDIQMLLVSDDIDYADVVSGFTEMENRIGRTVHPVLLKTKEFQSLIEEGNEGVTGILRQPRILLKGVLD